MAEARIPLTFNLESRAADTSKDARIVNGIVEDERVIKRPGLIAMSLSTTLSTGVGQGLFSWADQLIAAVNGHIYSILPSSGSVTELIGSPFTGMSNTIPLSFSSTINDTWMAFHDGTNLFAVNTINNTIISPLGGTGVISTTITNPGGYYYTPPSVTFSGATPATGTAVLYNNQLSSITLTSAGTYAAGVIPTISIGAPPAGTTATYTGTVYNTQTGVYFSTTTTGSGYVTAPTPIVNGGTFGSGTGYSILNTTGGIAGFVLTEIDTSNIGHSVTVTFPAPVTTTATAVANMNSTISGPFVPGIVYLDSTMYVMTTGQIIPSTSVVTISNANPAVVSWTGHNQSANTQIMFTTTGTLPSPLAVGTIYYILAAGLTANSFEISLTVGGTPIPTTTAGSGTHTATTTPITPSVIYGSGLNNPTSWNALNFIQASSDSDQMVGIARHLNYIVAFGTSGTQFFYDAGLPSPGSPLAENKSAYLEIGCANGYTIASAEQTLIWVSTSVTEGRSVYLLSGLSPQKISTKYVERYLNASSMSGNNSNARAYCFKISGHTFYVLSLIDLNVTLVCDLDSQKWYQWTSQTGDTGITNSGTETYFSPAAFSGNIEYIPGGYFLDNSNGKIYIMSPNVYDDAGNLIYFRMVSPRLDSGTKKRKFYKRVELVGDTEQGSGWIRHFDDDYATPSTYRSVDLSVTRPVLYQNGASRRRAWELFISDKVPVRVEALEIEFDVGEMEQG